MVESLLTGLRALITGATGFMGTHLALELVRRGAIVHALRRRPEQSTRLPCDGIVWHKADLTDPASLRQAVACAEPVVVFHLAAYGVLYGQDDDAGLFAGNVVGTWNVWQALEGFPARLVYTGSCGEYGNSKGQVREDQLCLPAWFYPATKTASTVLLSSLGRTKAREVVVLRPFGPYGAADNAARVVPHTILSLLRGEEVQVTAGEQLRDYCHVDDHVAALIAAGTKPLPESGRIYNVGSGKAIRLRTMLEMIAHAVGGTAPDRVKYGAIPYRQGEIWEMCCDIRAACTDLGYEPKVDFADGVGRTVEWYRAWQARQ